MRRALALALLLASIAHAQPAPEGLPLPVRTTSVAPVSTAGHLAGRYDLRGFTTVRSSKAKLATSARVVVSRLADGSAHVVRTWEVTGSDGVERSFRAETCEVRAKAPGVLWARLPLPAARVGLAGALTGETAAVTTEVVWQLTLKDGMAYEQTHGPDAVGYLTGALIEARDLASSPAVTTLVSSGAAADRFDLVFVSDGYRADELPLFRRQVRAALARLQATSPFKEYWGYLNVHRVDVASSGVGLSGGRGGPSALGTKIPTGVPSAKRIPKGDDDRVRKAVKRAPGADAVVVMCLDDFRSVADDDVCYVNTFEDRFPYTVVHELGHSIGRLLDEYNEHEADGWDFLAAKTLGEEIRSLQGWGGNVTTKTTPSEVPWAHWLSRGAPVPTPAGSGHAVGVYKGAYHLSKYWYRPSETCCMRDTRQPFCVVCRERLVLKLSAKTNPVTTKLERLDEDRVRITLTCAIPGAYSMTWRRGAGFVSGAGDSVVVTRDQASWGDSYLWCEVVDRGGWVRRDEDGVSRFTVRFLLRKGLIWDKGLDVHGPFTGPPPADGAGFGSSSRFPF
jgi:hypothetical protein